LNSVLYWITAGSAIHSYFDLLQKYNSGNPQTKGDQLFPSPEFRKDRCYLYLARRCQASAEVEQIIIEAVDMVKWADRFKLKAGIRKKGQPLPETNVQARPSRGFLTAFLNVLRRSPDQSMDPQQMNIENPDAPRQESSPDSNKKRIRIVIIGGIASGKTTIIDQLHRAVRQNVIFGPVILSPAENIEEIRRRIREGASFPLQTLEDIVVYEGKIKRRGSICDFRITDSRGGLLAYPPPPDDAEVKDWPLLYKETVKANLIALVIPADYFDLGHFNRQTLAFMMNYVQDMLVHKPQSMVAIVYSKCDEFGVVMRGSRRVIETPNERDKFDAFRRAPDHMMNSAWEDFLDMAAGTDHDKDDSVRLRRYLIDETRLLWQTIGSERGFNHKFINGYFVAAQPALPTKEEAALNGGLICNIPINWPARGFPLMFADFFYHIENMRGSL
jgi:translation initiation factor 2 beta subunit (eIF-2beta)/eIF-5